MYQSYQIKYLRSTSLIITVMILLACKREDITTEDIGTKNKFVFEKVQSGEYGPIQSVLIYKDQQLITEGYFNGSHQDDVHTMQSVSKSITSLLTGIAIEKGFIKSKEDYIKDYLPEYIEDFNNDPLKSSIRIIDLLNMKSGLDWSEDPYIGSPLHELNTSSNDWAALVVKRGMRYTPGTHWQYNSGGIVLLSKILWNATRMRTDSFAAAYLFKPLQIDTARWYRSPFDKLPHTGGGVLLKARSLMNIGICLLQNGKWNHTQVIPEQWLKTSFSPAQATSLMGYQVHHQYAWWLFPETKSGLVTADKRVITASGAMGQWMFLFPEKNIVIVLTGNANGVPDQSLRFLYDVLIPVYVSNQ